MQEGGLLALGFKVPGYVYGALIGIAFLALLRKGNFLGISMGAVFAVVSIAWMHIVGISFFWWFPVGAMIVVVTALVLDGFSRARVNNERI